MLEKGLVQIYTGDGKGKTTAAIGLALRVAGHGHKVLIYHYLKPSSIDSGERKLLKGLGDKIQVKCLEAGWDMQKSLDEKKAVELTKEAIAKSLCEIAEAAKQRLYDVIILDEIIFCLSKGLVKLEDIKGIIDGRESHVEIVMTGRGANEEIIALADIVTEMKKIKHPYDNGTKARKGIEY